MRVRAYPNFIISNGLLGLVLTTFDCYINESQGLSCPDYKIQRSAGLVLITFYFLINEIKACPSFLFFLTVARTGPDYL